MQRERRLTRAVRAEQRDALAGFDAQTDAEQRLIAVRIDVREIADLERGNGHDRIHAVAATNAAPTGKSIATPQAAVPLVFDVVAGMVPS